MDSPTLAARATTIPPSVTRPAVIPACGRWMVVSPWPLPGRSARWALADTHAAAMTLAAASARDHGQDGDS